MAATPALQPLMPFIDGKAPNKPRKVSAKHYAMTGTILTWQPSKAKHEMDKSVQYVVYRFKKGEKMNMESSDFIVAITRETALKLPTTERGTQYVVTALDRLHNESKPVKVKL